MEKKIYPANCITLDGRMDEAVWNEVPTYTDFTFLKDLDNRLQEEKTYFKILPCEDRVYIGVKCMEPDVQAEIAKWNKARYGQWSCPGVQLFVSPTGKPFEYYQFIVGWFGARVSLYYSEGGNIQPDPYDPVWRAEVYTGEDYWSCEIEFPLTAFYMTTHEQWSEEWLFNMCRVRYGSIYSSWCPLELEFLDPEKFRCLGGFPMRPVENDVCMTAAIADLTDETENGYTGTLSVKVTVAVAGEFEFTSDYAESKRVSLNAGENEFTTPCFFEKAARTRTDLSLKRISDGVEFKRHYPVLTIFEPIKLIFTKPGYRSNFYPGQDYSQVVGKVIATKPITLKLEGPGIQTQVLIMNGSGDFVFDTADFEVGTACLTATIDGHEVKKSIRRLAPTGHTMTWIEEGNICCDGETVLPRIMCGPGYLGGEAFNARYKFEEQYTTEKFIRGEIQMKYFIRGSETTGGECLNDTMPSDEMLRKMEAAIESYKDKDFGYYYLCDEPECRAVSPIYLKYAYEFISERDPYHVIMIATRAAATYVECADWFQVHPYPSPYVQDDGTRIYARPTSSAGRYIDDIVDLNRPDKCVGYLPCCYAYDVIHKNYDYPTFDEYISNTWAGMMHGGKSLWPYSYHGMSSRPAMYHGSRYMFSSFEVLEKIVLFGKRTKLYRSELGDAVLYEHDGVKMLVVVNFTQKEQTFTLDLEDVPKYEFRSDRIVSSNTFKVKPCGVFICTSTVIGADLPTYDETLALINNEEYERTHRGSLLAGRWTDEVLLSYSKSQIYCPWRLFDGVYDNYCVLLEPDETMFIALDLSIVKPTFTKVVVHGYNVSRMELKLDGQPVTFNAAEITAEDNIVTILLKESVTPDALRLEFNNGIAEKEKVELYEIELF